MKPTAAFLAVLFVGCSLGAKDKTVAVTHDGDLIPEASLTKEDTTSSSSLPASLSSSQRQAASPKPAKFELLEACEAI